ncbi:MAG: hypothetical protein GXP08_16795 [Gammaproteobacteria bacterium]|nr:hypothetical protein [Gammaproteobacteria bacterium]
MKSVEQLCAGFIRGIDQVVIKIPLLKESANRVDVPQDVQADIANVPQMKGRVKLRYCSFFDGVRCRLTQRLGN